MYSIASYSKWHNVDADLEAIGASASLDVKTQFSTNTKYPREVVGIWANAGALQATTATLRCRTFGSNEVLNLVIPLNQFVAIPVRYIHKEGTNATGLHVIGEA